MIPWLFLILGGLAAAGPSYRVSIHELLPPPPPWHPDQREVDAEVIDVPAFQRGAVESPPTIENSLEGPVTHEEYGSQRYPLRDAVEALPANAIDPQGGSLHLQDIRESVASEDILGPCPTNPTFSERTLGA